MAGFGVGMASAKIGQVLLAKCSGFMGKVSSLIVSKGAEYASDFAMSMLVDLVLSQQIDLSGETLSELLN